MGSKRSSKSRRKKIKPGTKDNLNTIITNLSIIIGRRKWPNVDPIEEIAATFKRMESFIAGISLSLPEIDTYWHDTGAKQSFAKIKRNRRIIIGLLISIAVFVSLLVTGGAIAAIIFIDHWSKYIILLATAIILFFGSTNFNKILNPILVKKDKEIPEKYQNECSKIDDFVTQLVTLRRKL